MPLGDCMPSRYLAEWYTPHLEGRSLGDVARHLRESLAAMPADAHAPELLYALVVPEDSYALGVFLAESADSVTDVCQTAEFPADRVTSAVEAD